MISLFLIFHKCNSGLLKLTFNNNSTLSLLKHIDIMVSYSFNTSSFNVSNSYIIILFFSPAGIPIIFSLLFEIISSLNLVVFRWWIILPASSIIYIFLSIPAVKYLSSAKNPTLCTESVWCLNVLMHVPFSISHIFTQLSCAPDSKYLLFCEKSIDCIFLVCPTKLHILLKVSSLISHIIIWWFFDTDAKYSPSLLNFTIQTSSVWASNIWEHLLGIISLLQAWFTNNENVVSSVLCYLQHFTCYSSACFINSNNLLGGSICVGI